MGKCIFENCTICKAFKSYEHAIVTTLHNYCCADCPVPFAIVFRGPEINELNKSPEDMDTVTLVVLNAR